jgi:hypothetical protein
MKKKCGKNYFKGPKMAAKDDTTILFAATILTVPTVIMTRMNVVDNLNSV